MLNQQQIDSISTEVRTAQIVAFGLMMGVLIFGVIVCVIVPWADVHSRVTILTAVGLFAAMSMIVMSFVLPRVISASAAQATAAQLRSTDAKAIDERSIKGLAGQFQTTNIIRMAMLEGAAFLNLVLFFVDKSLIELVMAAICLLLLIVGFPSSNRIIGWIENHMDQVQDHVRAG